MSFSTQDISGENRMLIVSSFSDPKSARVQSCGSPTTRYGENVSLAQRHRGVAQRPLLLSVLGRKLGRDKCTGERALIR